MQKPTLKNCFQMQMKLRNAGFGEFILFDESAFAVEKSD